MIMISYKTDPFKMTNHPTFLNIKNILTGKLNCQNMNILQLLGVLFDKATHTTNGSAGLFPVCTSKDKHTERFQLTLYASCLQKLLLLHKLTLLDKINTNLNLGWNDSQPH